MPPICWMARTSDYELIFPENIHQINMSMERRRDFYLIFKEAINNLTKYSQATEAAEVKVFSEDEKLILQVNDNGIGFDNSKPVYGNGLTNMQQRAAFLE